MESAPIAAWSVPEYPLRSVLAASGIVIGVLAVVLVASVLANVRIPVALHFRAGSSRLAHDRRGTGGAPRARGPYLSRIAAIPFQTQSTTLRAQSRGTPSPVR